MAKCAAPWLSDPGAQSEIVVSTRIRLARNIAGFPFPGQAKKETRFEIIDSVNEVISGLPVMADSIVADLASLPKIDRQLLFERHLISREQAKGRRGSGVFISAAETCSILVNEEDHLRLQIIKSGLRVTETWAEMNRLDDSLSRNINYSFKKDLGFLTACPTNVGTGLRASVMLHLPALVFNNQIKPVIRALEYMKFAVRGLYGEGSDSIGNFFQVSNQSTLGESEEDIISRLEKMIGRVIEHEMNARQLLLQQSKNELCDAIGRSFGVLKHCFLLSSKEALTELSSIRLGVDLGMFSSLCANTINGLLLRVQSAHLQKNSNKKLTEKGRDLRRAELVKNVLVTN